VVDENGQVLDSVGEFFSEKGLVKWLKGNPAVLEEENDSDEDDNYHGEDKGYQ
jgi:hypothetical protein